jgi:hypothetical protein
MGFHAGHSMIRPSVCSRREPSKIAQGKQCAALGKRLSHRPSRAENPRSHAFPGFHPGLFSSLPSGKNCAECRAIPPFGIAVSKVVCLTQSPRLCSTSNKSCATPPPFRAFLWSCAEPSPCPPCELAATRRTRDAEPDRIFTVKQYTGHHPQTRLVVFLFAV